MDSVLNPFIAKGKLKNHEKIMKTKLIMSIN
jgi:hypothetical protein